MRGMQVNYYVYAYNYLTLYKAIIYAEREWGVSNTYIIYTSFLKDLPIGLLHSKYNIYVISSANISHKTIGGININYIDRLLDEKVIVNFIISYIKSIERKCNSRKNTLVVFRDTLIRESLLISKMKRYCKDIKIILIEEGLALYASPSKPVLNTKLITRYILHMIMGIPVLPLKGYPHGCNILVDEIICRRPEAIKRKKQDKGNNIIKERDLFCKEDCSMFISDILMINMSEIDYDYVYLTQPLFPRLSSSENNTYDVFLKKLFSITSKYGKLLIKPHPNDEWDYSKYKSDKVVLCDSNIANCPFECLMGYYGNPQTITLFSSAACNINSSKPNLFLYDFFPNIIRSDIFGEEFIQDYSITRCKNFVAFENALYKSTSV